MIDSTAVRATRACVGAGIKGPEEPLDHAPGGSRGRLTTKIHMLCDEHLRRHRAHQSQASPPHDA